MNKFNWQAIATALEARKIEERAVLLACVLAVLAYGWMFTLQDSAAASRAALERRIAVSAGQIAEQTNRQAEIQATFSSDPNSFALQRLRELADATASADAQLDRIYGELISARQMSLVLTTILQRETVLQLVRLENLPSEALITTPGFSAAGGSGGDIPANIQVFKHGLRMTFTGSFLETVNYLRSLERLDTSFFWENLDFSITEHPGASISLDIFTLSTQRGWIGV